MSVEVFLRSSHNDKLKVGRLSMIKGVIYFGYATEFLSQGFSLSPLRLKFNEIAQKSSNPRINFGLPGVFYDSLPDGWGLLLMKKHFEKRGSSFHKKSGLDMLSYLGDRAMGALVYQPAAGPTEKVSLDVAGFAREAQRIQKGHLSEVISQIIVAGGSPGGARPKALVCLNEKTGEAILGNQRPLEGYRPWLLKFAGIEDKLEDCRIEHIILEMAKKAGIKSEPSRLIQDKDGNRWFGTRRFDRGPQGEYYHTHSLAGLLNIDFRTPSLDYGHLLHITHNLTRGNKKDLAQALKLMTFNVMIGNRDDHAKNFSFLMKNGQWQIAPAYDLTYNDAYHGNHAMSVDGKSKSIESKNILEIAAPYFTEREAKKLLNEVLDIAPQLKKELKGEGIGKELTKYLDQSLKLLRH